jgi:hypothetical protein
MRTDNFFASAISRIRRLSWLEEFLSRDFALALYSNLSAKTLQVSVQSHEPAALHVASCCLLGSKKSSRPLGQVFQCAYRPSWCTAIAAVNDGFAASSFRIDNLY